MKSNFAMKLYRISRFFYLKKLRLPAVFFSGINRVVFNCQIPPSASLAPSAYLLHNGLGVVIHEKAIVKANVLICQNVTIGGGVEELIHVELQLLRRALK